MNVVCDTGPIGRTRKGVLLAISSAAEVGFHVYGVHLAIVIPDANGSRRILMRYGDGFCFTGWQCGLDVDARKT